MKISYNTYKDMVLRVIQFENERGRKPNFVTVNGTKITKNQYEDMINRVDNFIKTKGRNPKAVNVKTDSAPKPIQKSTFTNWYNGMIGVGYGHYNNDKYNEAQEDYNIAHHIAMNCSDYSQTALRKAKELGYEARYIHVKCQSGEGHVYIQVKGREFTDWTNADVAAAASVGSKYHLGKVWCSKPKTWKISNEAWLTVDDGH